MKTLRISNMATLFATLLIADGALTFWATNHGFTEVNPLMAPFAHTVLYPVLKLVTALLATLIVTALSKRFPRLQRVARVGYALFSAFYVIILATNVIELVS
jgi:hypothetical protein